MTKKLEQEIAAIKEHLIRLYKDDPNYFACRKIYRSCIVNFPKLKTENISDVNLWANISSYNNLSEEFIEEFKENLNWKIICEEQKLSESFIKKHRDKVIWDEIGWHQNLSEEFILEFKGRLCLSDVAFKQVFSFDTALILYNFQKTKEEGDLFIEHVTINNKNISPDQKIKIMRHFNKLEQESNNHFIQYSKVNNKTKDLIDFIETI